MRKWLSLSIIGLFFLALDFISKSLVVAYIPKMSWLHPFYPYGGIGIFENFLGISLSINNVENTGAAWGSFSSYGTFLFYFRILIVILLLVYLIISKMSYKNALFFTLIITGAIGNIIDFAIYSHVIDMIHFEFGSYSFPVFNIADSLITIGIICLIINSFITLKKERMK